jgi:hypothetical protein
MGGRVAERLIPRKPPPQRPALSTPSLPACRCVCSPPPFQPFRPAPGLARCRSRAPGAARCGALIGRDSEGCGPSALFRLGAGGLAAAPLVGGARGHLVAGGRSARVPRLPRAVCVARSFTLLRPRWGRPRGHVARSLAPRGVLGPSVLRGVRGCAALAAPRKLRGSGRAEWSGFRRTRAGPLLWARR